MSYVKTLYPSGMSTEFSPSFVQAAAFWNNVITKGHSGYYTSSNLNVKLFCQTQGAATIPAGTTIQGLYIYAEIVPIDGTGGILGAAGPCLVNGDMPMVGIMRFDSADSLTMLNQGSFTEVIVHEMGHVIGIGSLWSRLNLVRNPCTGSPCTTNPTYVGANGLDGYADLGGTGSLAVANTGTAGTYNAHWRESVFQYELMTGYLNSGMPNPLSIMSIKSMIDLGYGVDTSAAEEYFIPSEVERPMSNISIELVGDMIEFDLVDIHDALDIQKGLLGRDVEQESTKAEFTGAMFTIVIGFLAIGFMMVYFAQKQKKMIMELASGSGQQCKGVDGAVKIKSQKYIEP